MPIVNGFTEKYGNNVKKSNYVELKLMSIAYKYCYDEIKIPIIEYYTSFDEGVVVKAHGLNGMPREYLISKLKIIMIHILKSLK